MGKRAAELWERGQQLDGSAEELLAELREENAERDWDRETILRRMIGGDGGVTSRRSNDD